MPLARADVRDVCFAHWPVDAGDIATRLPSALSPATRDGTAWVSVLCQRTLARLGPLPWRYEYAQLAVRTYVAPAGREPRDRDVGVYFLRIDADSRLASLGGRVLFDVPFRHADVVHRHAGDRFEVGSADADGPSFRARFEPAGEPTIPDLDALDAWLTDRYRYYLPGGRYGVTDHEPWRLSDASVTVERNALFDSLDIPEPTSSVVAGYSPGADFWLARRP